MPWINPIYDRTQSDVNYANANRNSGEMLKGALNYTDLQRITGNIHYLSEWLYSYGYLAPVTCKTDWTLGEIPRRAEIEKIRLDVQVLRGVFDVFQSTPQTPDMPLMHYQKINDVEKILFDVEAISKSIMPEFIFSGEILSGEDDYN